MMRDFKFQWLGQVGYQLRFVVVILGLLFIPSLFAHQITVVTEEAYPIQYLQQGEVKGPATKLVRQVLASANLTYQIQVLPWARAYKLALTQPNVLIYSIARTQQREPLFHWIGKVTKLNYALYARKELNIKNLTKLEQFQPFKIGVVNRSAIHQYLAAHGFKNLELVTSGPQNIKKLLAGRVQFIPANVESFQQACTTILVNCADIEPKFPLRTASTDLFFAMSANSDRNLIKQVRKAYQQILKRSAKVHE